MSSGGPGRSLLSRISARLTDAPLILKLLGIGGVLTVIFGTVTLWHARRGTHRILQQLLELRSFSLARSLAETLERPLNRADRVAVVRAIRAARERSSDLLYVVVRDGEGRIVGHSFEHAVPPALRDRRPPPVDSKPDLVVFDSPDGEIFDVIVPVGRGGAGTVEGGLTDAVVAGELSTVTAAILWGLGASAVLGIALAFGLSCLVIRPVRHLIGVAHEIRSGNFRARATQYHGDEIGDLAETINEMAAGLESYRLDVEEKERARQALLDRVVTAQEEERKSIARELHDHVGQSLMAILLTVQSACRSGTLVGSVCREVEQRLRSVAEDVRRLAWGMRPAILDDYGLDTAVRRYLEEVAEHSDLEPHFESSRSDGQERLPRHVELALYRVCQEAVTNVLRHAGASRISVVLIQRSEAVTLLIEDDGQGFDARVAPTARGLGILGMRERVKLLDGALAVESTPGQGTTLRAWIPLHGVDTA